MEKALIIGNTGFVDTHIAEYLLNYYRGQI